MGSETTPATRSDRDHAADRAAEHPLPPDQEVARQFLRMERHHHTMRSHGSLHAADVRLLWLLTASKPLTLREIADALRLEQSTVNRQVNAALRNGFVHRFKDGRTAMVVAPTERGREVFRADTAITQRVYRHALNALGAEDAEVFVRLLAQFVEGTSSAIHGLEG